MNGGASEGADRGTRSIPIDAVLQVRGAAWGACRRHGLVGEDGEPDRVVVLLLATAAGLETGLAGANEAQARHLQRECAEIFKRAYEASAAAGQLGAEERG